MNINEKIDELFRVCNQYRYCDECPLGRSEYSDCAFGNYSNEDIETAYNLVFGDEKEEINHPDRYAGGNFECIDVMLDVFGADAVKHFCILNAFKYLWRAENKNGIEDIKKAVFYLNYYIDLMEGDNESDK